MQSMRILTILDPPHLLKPAADSTVAILDEALLRGHELSICEINDLWLSHATPGAAVRRVQSISRTTAPAIVVTGEAPANVPLEHFHAVLMRKDPPYDGVYHLATQILEFARGKAFLLNDPRGLREANEKLYAFHFPELLPPTLITRKLDELRDFLTAQGGDIVIKPLDGFGGAAVFRVRSGDSNTNAIFEVSTLTGQRWVMAQRYLPEGKLGDKRILVLGGEPIGAVLRVPQGSDIRSNLAVGGKAVATELSERDHEICARIAPRLQQDGLHLVGIDVIGTYLSEINVTSPTGIQAIDRLQNIRIENKIVDYIERHAPRSL
jgi:glutathione synthase